MKKSTLQKMHGFMLFALLLMASASWGQVQYTIVRGHSNYVTDSNATGITTTVSNVLSSCNTSGGNTTSSMTMAAQSGFTYYVTSVNGNRYRSNAGWASAAMIFANANTGTNQTTGTVSVAGSSSCGTATNLGTFTYGASVQNVPSGQSSTISVVPSGSGAGYSGTKSITAIVTVTGIGTITNSSNAAITSLAGFGNVNVGNTSGASSFVLQPSAISGSSILVTAPAGFLVCETTGGTYTQSIAFVNNTAVKTIYVKFAPTVAGAQSGAVVVSKQTNGGTVTTRSVSVSGNGVAVNPPVITSSLTDTSIYGATDTYQITATNTPNAYTATYNGGALPAGVTVNTSGLISIAATLNAGTYEIVINASNAGAGAGTAQTLVYTRAPKPLTLTGGDADDKAYDATTAVTILTAPTLSGIVGSDVVNITGTPVAELVSKNAGTRQVRFTGGYDADNNNYTIQYPQEPTGVTANIAAIPATVSGISIEDKIFDGTTTATISGTPVLNGIIPGDDVTLNSTNAEAEFTDSTEGAVDVPVIVSGYVLAGIDAANYTLTQPTGLTADILDDGHTDQTISFSPLSNVVYGTAPFVLTATTDAPLTVTYTSSNESVATVSGSTVTITGVGTTTITASQEGDATHSPAVPVAQDLTVTPKALTIIDAAVTTKVYDGTDAATVTATLNGIVGTDDVTYTYEAIFEDKNVGENKDAVAEFELTGTRAFNYTLPVDLISLTGTITPKAITLSNAAAANKVYDTTAAATVTGTLTGVVPGDVVTFSGAGTGTFADVNAGTGIAVTVPAALNGADAANYTLTQPVGLSADITARGITVTATAANKVYDRTTFAEITVGTITGVINTDDVIVTGNGTFNNYDAATNKPVTTALVLGGAQAANYSLIQPTGITANITKKEITADITAAVVSDKTYNNTITATVSGVVLNGVIAEDEAALTVTAASFAQPDAGTDIVVSNFVLSGTATGNYTLTQPVDTLLGNIVPATLTLNSAAAQNKSYDGTDAATITGNLAGAVAGAPAVSYTGTGTFANVNVGTGIAVTPAIVLTGAGAGNYVITQPAGLIANITPRGVTVSATALSKVYDDTTATTVTDAAITAGILGDNEVLLEATTVPGTFNTPAVGTNKPVSAVFTLTGEDAANYAVTVQTYPANITPVALTVDVTNAAVTTKTYDGTTAANVTGITAANITGTLPGNNVLVTTATFASANTGTGIAVTLLLTGTDGGNYTLTQPETLLTGTINKKVLTATADNKSKTQGAANPALTITYSGFVTGQNAANALNFVAPSINTTAVTASPVGAYPITLTGGSAANYQVSLVNGTLLVNTTALALLTFDTSPLSDFGPSPFTPASINANITSTGLVKGSAIAASGTPAGGCWGGSGGWSAGTGATTDNNSFNFTVVAATGYSVSISSVSTATRRSSSGPTGYNLYCSVNGSAYALVATATTSSTSGTTGTPNAHDLSGVAALQNVAAGTIIKFRLNPTGSAGNYYLTGGANSLRVSGSLALAPKVTNTLLTDSSDILSTDTYQVTATGTPQLTYSAIPLPAGATINSSTGLISFDGTTPAGVYPITISVSSYYGSDSKTLTYTVNKLNQVITFDPDPIPVQYVGNAPLLLEYNNTSGLPITWSSADETVATIDATGLITAVSQGTAVITASNPGNDIYNPVAQTITVTVGAPCFTWLGTEDNSWTNTANWCNALVPFADSEVVINPGTHNPVISTGIAHANTLTLNANAQLTVNTGATLSVEGDLHIDDTATLTVNDNGALLQGNEVTVNNNEGKITFHKLANPLHRLDYTLWSSPITGQTLKSFSTGTSNTRFYTYDYQAPEGSTTYNEAYWPVNPETTYFEEGKGYLIRMPNTMPAIEGYIDGTATHAVDGTFIGLPNNGNYNASLVQGGNGFSAVGNPYPSPISVSAFLLANSNKLVTDTGIWFWRKQNNSDSDSYVTLTLAGYAENPDDATTDNETGLGSFYQGGNSASWLIAPGQGFLVQAQSGLAEPTVSFTNTMRRATPATQAFFRQAADTASRYWLNITAQSGAASQALVAYMEGATLGLDYGYDGKRFSNGSVSLYSTIQNSKLAIQARPEFEASDVVPMGFTAPTAGQYTISIDHMDGVFSQAQAIYLKDLQEGIIRNLSLNDYTFTTEAGTFDGRFEVHYTNQALGTDAPVLDANSVIVFKQGNAININTGNAMINSVKVFDIRGRQLYSQGNINATETAISNLNVQQEVLIIEIATEKGTVSKRIVF